MSTNNSHDDVFQKHLKQMNEENLQKIQQHEEEIHSVKQVKQQPIIQHQNDSDNMDHQAENIHQEEIVQLDQVQLNQEKEQKQKITVIDSNRKQQTEEKHQGQLLHPENKQEDQEDKQLSEKAQEDKQLSEEEVQDQSLDRDAKILLDQEEKYKSLKKLEEKQNQQQEGHEPLYKINCDEENQDKNIDRNRQNIQIFNIQPTEEKAIENKECQIKATRQQAKEEEKQKYSLSEQEDNEQKIAKKQNQKIEFDEVNTKIRGEIINPLQENTLNQNEEKQIYHMNEQKEQSKQQIIKDEQIFQNNIKDEQVFQNNIKTLAKAVEQSVSENQQQKSNLNKINTWNQFNHPTILDQNLDDYANQDTNNQNQKQISIKRLNSDEDIDQHEKESSINSHQSENIIEFQEYKPQKCIQHQLNQKEQLIFQHIKVESNQSKQYFNQKSLLQQPQEQQQKQQKKQHQKQITKIEQIQQEETQLKNEKEIIQNSEQIKKQIDQNILPITNQSKNQDQKLSSSPSFREKLNELEFKIQQAQEKKKIDGIEEKAEEGEKSPRKEGVGKINRKVIIQAIHEKKVHEIVKDLQRTDEINSKLPLLEPKKPKRQKYNLDRLDAKITIASNVMNVTVGQIICDEQEEETKKLINQIKQLKEKLNQLQFKNSQFHEPLIDSQAEKSMTYNKTMKKAFFGRIYKKNQHNPNQSRVSDHSQTFNNTSHKKLRIETVNNPENNQTKFGSTLGFSQSNKHEIANDQRHEIANDNGSKAANLHFRVKRSGKEKNGSQLQNKDVGHIKNVSNEMERSRMSSKIQFLKEQKLEVGQQSNQERKYQFTPNFREEVDAEIVDIGEDTPNADWNQRDLIELAKLTFEKFGISMNLKHHAVLNVKKYKNCVSFNLTNQATILWYYQGKFYFGGWVVHSSGEGEKQGWGYEFVPEKFIYKGQFKENKRNGQGTIKFLTQAKDIIYSGDWFNGYKHGYGKQIQIDDSQYIGEWYDGKKHGFAKVKVNHKEHFQGNFFKGLKHGQGIEHFANGDLYQGEYLNGKFHGQGIYTWANNSIYSGEFNNGYRNGHGYWRASCLDPKSDSYDGQYKSDKKNGFGIYKWKDGTIYEGQFVNDLKHGEGIVKYGDGKMIKFQWMEGVAITKNVNRVRANSNEEKNRKTSEAKSSIQASNKEKLKRPSQSVNKYKLNEVKSKYPRDSLQIENI